MRTLLLGIVVVLSVPAMAMPATVVADATQESSPDGPPNPCVGTMTEQPDEETLISIQGIRLTDDGYVKKPAMLVSFAPNGSFEWARNASAHGRSWAYDVDPMDNGDLLFATTEHGVSLVGRLDPDENEYVWLERFEEPESDENPHVIDAHDADRLNEHEIVIADKGEGHERLLVYNRTRGEVVWEWRFEDHPEVFPESGGGPAEDWTHLNDVEAVGDDQFMISVRNFDQVAFVNRTTGDVDLMLGEDDNYDILNEQHNPDHLRGPDGERTVLVADSENDRVVEYAYDDETESWDRVWAVTGMDEPRDADRLENGNTLIADRMGHRLVEVNPQGEVVWEVYTPWEPYDAERGNVDESDGPTMRELDANGSYEARGGANFTGEDIEKCAASMYEFARQTNGDSKEETSGVSMSNGSIVTGDGTEIPVVPLAAGSVVVVALAALAYRQWS
ncbi:aryl-sulfate sulfotransferase [Halostella pelagica]|uniref:aryl-sulfate sulfotransferase n=1 Tax=Halostella pelagica TaxID=2583824 RepID=UPI0010819089|nr:aryl-sulfate sulfotransferase [Halostella pelagica]